MSGTLSRIGSSVMGGLFPNQGASSYSGPTNWYTPYSSAVGGTVNLDPSIRSLQDQYLSQVGGLGTTLGQQTQGYVSNLQDIGQRYLGNEGAYIQAAVDPILQQGNQAIGAYTAGAGLRGLGGSSFLGNQLSAMGTDLGRSVADAKAQAVAQNLGFETGLQGNILGAQQQQGQFGMQTSGALDQVSQQRLSQELSSLGLGQSEIAQLMNAFQNQQGRALGLQGQQLGGVGMLTDIFKAMRGGGGSA